MMFRANRAAMMSPINGMNVMTADQPNLNEQQQQVMLSSNLYARLRTFLNLAVSFLESCRGAGLNFLCLESPCSKYGSAPNLMFPACRLNKYLTTAPLMLTLNGCTLRLGSSSLNKEVGSGLI